MKQAFRIYYTDETFFDFDFKKIKSLFFGTTCSPIQPSVTQITAARCQVVNIPISFSNIQWSTSFESPILCFGSISEYEYQLPANWKIGTSFTSTGSNWYAGGSSVTVTSDLSSGIGGYVTIRPRNTACGTGLTNGASQAVYIPINRPAPTFSITVAQAICSGASTYTLNGVPAGATVSWSLSSTTNASIPNPSTGTSVNVTRIGTMNTDVTLYATVTDCIQTYPAVSKIIALGTPVLYTGSTPYKVWFGNPATD